MKLHEIKKGSKLKLETDKGWEIFIFDHLDGMYSYCYSKVSKDKVIHLSASTPLKKEEDYYLIEE